MNLQKLWTDDRAVSPVVGVALLIAITVILAAVIGGVVLGLGTSSASQPQASLQFEYNETASELTIHHQSGDTLEGDQVVVKGATEAALGADLSAGQSITVGVSPDANDRIAVVWQDPNSNEESVLATYRA